LSALPNDHKELISNWTDCWFGENKTTGYVTVTDFNFSKSYGSKDTRALERDTEGKEQRFISLNGFTFGERKADELKQIRNIGIDLDQYKEGMSIEEGLDELQALIVSNTIPEPNLVLTSRGIQLFYSINGGAAPNMSWLSNFITEQYISKLRHIGADSNAKDLSRVMRVPNSVNERNGALVKVDIWNPQPYSLRELQSYCKPLDTFKYRGKKKAEIRRVIPKNLSLFYKTNNSRLVDLDKLIDLRNGDLTGYRNKFLYIYAYHQALLCNNLKDLEAFIYNVLDRIHSTSDKPMSKAEVRRTVKSAYEDSREFFEHYKSNDYKVVNRLNDGIIKPYKTTNLIKVLGITVDEQYKLRRIHTGDVSKEKEAQRKRKERRESGSVTQKDYQAKRKKKSAALAGQVKKMNEQGVKKAVIAKELGITRQQVYNLLKSVK
jgi:Helix-turn-helix domain of resolvase